MSRGWRLTLRLRLALWIGGAALTAGLVGLWIAPLVRFELVTVLVAVVACGLAGYAIAGRQLRPLHEITATARKLSGDTLNAERIAVDGPRDELRELAETFNSTLDRIASSVDEQRRFVSNASHELRTPLAVMRTEIDVALSGPDDDVAELRAMAEVVRDNCDRINDLIESLLWLARAEAEGEQCLSNPRRTDLGECAETVVADAQRAVDTMELSLALSRLPAPVIGDATLLERAAGNLVENAIRHNVPSGRIWVLTGSDATTSWLVVGNTGSTVDSASLPRLFEPFSRGGEARVGRRGAGLGMSIVRAVCRAHGGSVTARALPADGGLEVRLEIPVAGPDACSV